MDLSGEDLTAAVVASFDGSPDERTKEVLGALVRHLHAFAREVELTEEEWFAGIDFLTRTGHKSTGTRQEFVLLSDVLGLSMLTVGLGNKKPARRDRVDRVRPVLRRGFAGDQAR